MSRNFQGWNEDRLRELQASGKIRNFQVKQDPHKESNGKKVTKHFQKRSKEKDWIGWNLLYFCNEKCLELREDFRFHPERKWAYDWAIPSLKIAVEYEGLFSEKSRHTTAKGYTGDTSKYNAGQALGWKIIRLTALNYKTMLEELKKLIV